MKKLDNKQWTNYWQENSVINSFGPDNYNNEIIDFWQQQLQGQPYKKIIDLACGNGAISWLANDILNSKTQNTEIIGVDFSDIEPFSILKRDPKKYPMVSFIGNCAIEKLPFNDHSFDAAISQYGIEYSNLQKSVSEVSRVLKPNSNLYFIVHNQDSEIVKQSTQFLKQYEVILNDLRLHEDFLTLDKIIGTETDIIKVRGMSAFVQLKQVIEAKIIPINQIIKSIKNPVALTTYKQHLISHFSDQAIANGPEGRKESVLTATNNFRSYIKRIKDLQGIALSKTDIDKFSNLLYDHGFTQQQHKTLSHGDLSNIGHIIIAQR